MKTIKSLEELNQLKQTLLVKREMISNSRKGEIIISIGSTSIAAGAQSTLDAVSLYLKKNKLEDCAVLITSSLGPESAEPLVIISIPPLPEKCFGKVTANKVDQLFEAYLNQTTINDIHMVQP